MCYCYSVVNATYIVLLILPPVSETLQVSGKNVLTHWCLRL